MDRGPNRTLEEQDVFETSEAKDQNPFSGFSFGIWSIVFFREADWSKWLGKDWDVLENIKRVSCYSEV